MTLPAPLRTKLKMALGIKQSAGVEIQSGGMDGSVVISDGVTAEDLREITVEKLETYTGVKGVFAELWEKAIEKADLPVSVGEKSGESVDNAVTEKHEEANKGTDGAADSAQPKSI